jgi:hypothetical protein
MYAEAKKVDSDLLATLDIEYCLSSIWRCHKTNRQTASQSPQSPRNPRHIRSIALGLICCC